MSVAPPKPYLYAEELAALTPWSVAAIRKKVQRGELRLGVHYFQEQHRSRLIFKWPAIVELIESRDGAQVDGHKAGGNGEVLNVEKATAGLRELLG